MLSPFVKSKKALQWFSPIEGDSNGMSAKKNEWELIVCASDGLFRYIPIQLHNNLRWLVSFLLSN